MKLRLIPPKTQTSKALPPRLQVPNIRSRIINLKGLLEILQRKSRRHACTNRARGMQLLINTLSERPQIFRFKHGVSSSHPHIPCRPMC